MLAAVSDPTMSQCLINHVDRKGPYAGVARVSDQTPFHVQALLLKDCSNSCCVPAITELEREDTALPGQWDDGCPGRCSSAKTVGIGKCNYSGKF